LPAPSSRQIIAHVSEGVRMARAELEMNVDGRAPEGVLRSSGGRGFRFSGWTQLAAAIEEWRSAARIGRQDDERGAEMHDERVPGIESQRMR
jgi:hypothetical protein